MKRKAEAVEGQGGGSSRSCSRHFRGRDDSTIAEVRPCESVLEECDRGDDDNAVSCCAVLPDEVLLHMFGYLDPPSLGAVLSVSHRWHELANDARLWKQLCLRSNLPKIDRRRFGQNGWKQWYRSMAQRININVFKGHGFTLNEYNRCYTVLVVDSDSSVRDLARAAGCSLMVAPHRIRLWRLDSVDSDGEDYDDDDKVLLADPSQKLACAEIKNGSSVLCEVNQPLLAEIYCQSRRL